MSVPTSVLSPRERDVLRFLAAGLSQKEIAKALGISAPRVQELAAQLRRKSGASTTTQAVALLGREDVA